MSTGVVSGKIHAVGGATEPDLSAATSSVEEYDTGFAPPPDKVITAVSDLGKLARTWGKVRAEH